MKIREFLFKNLNPRQAIFKNALWLIGGDAFSRLIRGGIIIYAIRVLGPGNYGVFTYGYGLAAAFMLFTDIGIAAFLTRETSKSVELREKYFGTAFIIKITLLVIATLAIIIVAPQLATIPESKKLIPLFAFVLAFDSLREFFNALPRAEEKMEVEGTIKMITNVIIVGFGIFLVSKNPTPLALAVAYLVGNGVGAVITVAYLWKKIGSAISHFERALVAFLFKTLWPFTLTQASGVFLTYSDTIMLGWLANKIAVGYYSAALKPVQLLMGLPYLFSISLFPILSRKAAIKDSGKVTEEGARATLLFILPVVILLFAFAAPIYRMIFGAEFGPSIPIFRVLLTMLILYFPSTILGSAAFAHNLQAKNVPWFIASSLLNVIGNYVLILRIGMVGAAISTVVAQTVLIYGSWRVLRSVETIQIFPHVWRGFTAAAVMIGAYFMLLLAHLYWIIAAFLMLIIYIVILAVLREPLFQDFINLFHPISDDKNRLLQN